MPSRIIREQCRRSKTLDQLSDFAERSWWRLITTCDDYGCFEADYDLLIADLYPLKARTMDPQQLAAACREWQDAGLVHFYTDSEKIYGACISWGKHQRVRDSKRKYPDPETCEGVDIANLPQMAAIRRKLPQVAATCGSRARACTRAHARAGAGGMGYGAEGMEPQGQMAAEDVKKEEALTPEALVDMYHAEKPEEFGKIEVLTESRKKIYTKYLTQFPSRSFWAHVFTEAKRSDFLRGLNPSSGHKKFKANLDWFCSVGQDGKENCVKTFEGKYHGESPPLCNECGHEVGSHQWAAVHEGGRASCRLTTPFPADDPNDPLSHDPE